MTLGYFRAAVSKVCTALTLHVVLFFFAGAENDVVSEVVSFQAVKEFIPSGQSMSFTCTVKGRAVWRFGDYYFNTATSDFSGNITSVDDIEGINISDSTASDSHLSKLFLSASFINSLNDSVVECGATQRGSTRPMEYENITIKVFGSPTTPGNPQVVSETEREVTLTWEPSFLPFDILPRYNVYVDDVLERTVDQPSFVFTRAEHTCDSHMIRVEAFNEVGSMTSDHMEVVLPTVPMVSGLSDSITTDITKTGNQVQFTATFNKAVSCDAHPVTNYTITLTSNNSAPVTKTIPTPPGDSVSITVGGLNDNTLYSYRVHAKNVIGSASSAAKTFYTTDVRSGIAMEMNEGALLLRCEFVQGSNALGCQVQLETQTQLGNITHILYRTRPDDVAVDMVVNVTSLSCYESMVVYDIESDNTTGSLGLPGDFQLTANQPCNAPLSEDTPLSMALIVGVSVAVAVAILLMVIILIVACCLLKNRAFGNRVKDTPTWIENANYPSMRYDLPVVQGEEPCITPLYDTVHTPRQTVPTHHHGNSEEC